MKSKKIALVGMMCALAAVIMLMGGLIPLATFCCPLLAGLALIPVFVECGEKLAWGAYIAISLLALILCPDKEAALLFAFVGYYPILRWRLDQIRNGFLRLAAKLAVFNVAVLAMYAVSIFIFQMAAIAAEYREMGLAMALFTLLLGNVTLVVYDVLLQRLTALYVVKFRDKLMK